jgi:N-methylhydantoinase B
VDSPRSGLTISTAPAADPVTLKIFQQRLVGIVGEMRSTMVQSAFSSSITELIDLSCAIFSKRGELVAQFEDNPQHIFPILWSVRDVLETYGDDIEPDDLFLHNDPYTGGTHLNDVCLIVPLFRDAELAFFPVVRAHWEDVGGATFGSISGDSRSIHQEGVRIPITRLKAGSRDYETVLRLLLANMRLPEERKADFDAMLGTCRIASRRLNDVIDRLRHAGLRRASDRAAQPGGAAHAPADRRAAGRLLRI